MVYREACKGQEGAETKLYVVAMAIFDEYEAIFVANIVGQS